MVFNATFSNTSVISWQSVLLVEVTGVPRENHWPVTSYWQTLSHNVVSNTPVWAGFELTTLGVIWTDCTGSCRSNYHTITAMAVPYQCTGNIMLGYYYRNLHMLIFLQLNCDFEEIRIKRDVDSTTARRFNNKNNKLTDTNAMFFVSITGFVRERSRIVWCRNLVTSTSR